MGSKKQKRGAKHGKEPVQPKRMDPMEIVMRAQDVLEVGDIEQAQSLMARALAAAPKNPDVLTAFGSMLAEVGNTDKAILTLRKAVMLEPNSGFEKYMYLGQLLDDPEHADSALSTGIEIMKADLEDLSGAGCTQHASHLRVTLAAGLCSLAETRLARAEALEDVAIDCEALLKQAIEVAPESPEALQALASLRYEQGKAVEALALLQQSMSRWWRPQTEQGETSQHGADQADAAMYGRDGTGGAPDDGERDGALPQAEPSYEFRFECCKLLLELDESTDTVISILEDLLAEYDDAPHTWHLLALAYYGGGNFDEAKESLEYGYSLLSKVGMTNDQDVVGIYDELKQRIAEATMEDEGE